MLPSGLLRLTRHVYHIFWIVPDQHFMSVDSTVASVPAPMAIPTSAGATPGASLTPSPTMGHDIILLDVLNGLGLGTA